MPTIDDPSDFSSDIGAGSDLSRNLASTMRAIAMGPGDPAYSDPSLQSWITLLKGPASPPQVPGVLGASFGTDSSEDDLSANEPSAMEDDAPATAGGGSDPEVAYAGTLVGQVYDPRVPETHCTYERPGMQTFTVLHPGFVNCPKTAPAPRG